MKIDNEYVKKLLEAFESADKPTTDLKELKQNGIDYESDIFIFHYELFVDEALTEGKPCIYNPNNRMQFKNDYDAVLRLTSKGHNFLKTLKDKEVWNTIKSDFKDSSIGTLLNASKMLFDKYLENKISKIME